MENNDNYQQLTKKERKRLKREQKEQELVSASKKKQFKRNIIIISLVILVVGGVSLTILFSGSSSNDNSSKNGSQSQGTPNIEVSPKVFDAGTVSMADGLVKHTYEVKNNGQGNLKIDKIWTSCMCTSAVLKIGDKDSPEFGMHNNPPFWSEEIAPGETGQLEVTFDPAFHGPDGTGSLTRAVYLNTNDPDQQKAEVKLLINVVK